MTLVINSLYTRVVLQRGEVAARSLDALEDVDFDTLVGTGLSGMLPLQGLANMWNKHMLVVRKPNDSSHSDGLLEGVLGDRWVFVDDFMSTGGTLKRTREAIDFECRRNWHESEFVGAFLYQHSEGNRFYTPDALANSPRLAEELSKC